MQTEIILRSIEDEEYGELGLMPVGVYPDDNRNAAMNGFGLAHDLLEHSRGFKNIGTVGDELIAFGAIYFTRGWSGSLDKHGRGMRSVDETLAMELANAFVSQYQHELNFGLYGSEAPLELVESVYDENIQCAIGDLELYIYPELDVGDYDPQDMTDYINEYKRVARILMNRGALIAEERFGKEAQAWDLFWAVEEAADSVIRNLHEEGYEYKLTIDGNRAWMEEHYEFDDDEEED